MRAAETWIVVATVAAVVATWVGFFFYLTDLGPEDLRLAAFHQQVRQETIGRPAP